MRIHRLDHIHIYSADPEASARFYVEVSKADTIGRAESSHGSAMHFLRLGGLALVAAPYPPGIEPGVTDHLIRVSDDGIQGVQGGMATCSVILRASQW